MPDVTVFDLHRVRRALDGRLAEGDAVEAVACDDISKAYWVLTREELVILAGDAISSRLPLARAQVSVQDERGHVELRVRDTAPGGEIQIASFRRHNKVTQHFTSSGGEPASE